MDIENIWQQQGKGEDDMLKELLKRSPEELTSKWPLKKLRANLLRGIVLSEACAVIYLAIIIYLPVWQIITSMLILILFNTWLSITSWKLYKKIPETISSALSLKQELEINYARFRQWFAVQERVSLFIYPIAATGGFMLGGVVGSQKTVEEFLYNPLVLSILAVTILILVPISYFVSRWFFNHTYGKYLKKLKKWIEELQ